MSEALLHVCWHTRAQLLREGLKLSALRDAAQRYREVVCASARALQLVADDRDAYVYYRVGEELDLGWDFSDPKTTCDMSRRLDRLAFALHNRPCAPFSGARLACVNKRFSGSAGFLIVLVAELAAVMALAVN